MNRLISISCCWLLKKTLVITTNLTNPESVSGSIQGNLKYYVYVSLSKRFSSNLPLFSIQEQLMKESDRKDMQKIDNVLAQVRLATSKTRLDMINTRVVLQVAKQLITLKILEKSQYFPSRSLISPIVVTKPAGYQNSLDLSNFTWFPYPAADILPKTISPFSELGMKITCPIPLIHKENNSSVNLLNIYYVKKKLTY